MKRIVVFILTAVGFFDVAAQKAQKTFTMPANAAYVRGRVLVKIKEEYKEAVSQLSLAKSSTSIKNVPLNSVAHIVKPQLDQFGSSKSARAQRPNVDISKYFYVSFDRDQNVEEYINKLYSTGYFEIVEPDFKHKADFVPNDAVSGQYYLGLIKAYDAWDITQGVDDSSIVIAIIDTGGNLTHSDLVPNLYYNTDENPTNGIDDDGNGYIDDYQGWDFVGSDTLNLYQDDYDSEGKKYGDNDPSVHQGGDIAHGTMVGGCASAASNNGKGIAGVAYKTKLLFTKQTGDNQLPSDGSEYNVYSAMLYAANLFAGKGIKGIINCSFGGSGQSQIAQDIINHIVLDKNCLVVAAAGNEHTSKPSFPAAYDNVLSAAACDANNKKASFTNYGTTVDITAPGVGIFTTTYDNDYTTVDGTSFSSPITSGAAALVWANNPSLSAIQVGEQLRVSADVSALYTANPTSLNQLGKGRLDVFNALTLESPSVRALEPKLVNQIGLAPGLGDKAFLTFNFKNYLKSTSAGLQISISTTSTAVAITKSTISPGTIAEGGTFSNNLTPFELTIQATALQNSVVNFLIKFTDGAYSDYQWATFIVNPSYIDVLANKVQTTVTSIGRLGYQDPSKQTPGIGFNFNDYQLLYEMGLIMGTDSTTHLYNNVRATGGKYDQDFASVGAIKQIFPGERTYSEIFGQFKNKTNPLAVQVDYRSLVMKDAPYDKFVILEYKVKNPTANPINNFYLGIFSDWDVSTNGQQDAAGWDANNKLGYVYPALIAAKPHAGIQVLTGSPIYYAIDNDQSIAGNPFGVYDGFSHKEKFISLTTNRYQAGQTDASGNDVSHVVSSGPYNIAANETVTIAFALHAANNLPELQTSARYADSLYNYTMVASKPIANAVTTCYDAQATLNASGASTIKWYTDFTGGQSFHTGSQYITDNLKSDTVFYVSNADHTYESVRTPINVQLKANPEISTSGSTTICEGDKVTLSVAPSDSTGWSTLEKTNAIEVSTAGQYQVVTKDQTLGCLSTSDPINVVVNPKPTADFTFLGDMTKLPTTFTDQSTDAASWFWDFGDGKNSSVQNPEHTFTTANNSVTLTVTSANGCSASKTVSVALITAIEPSQLTDFKIYPNPVANHDVHIVIDNDDMNQAQIVLTNSIGQVILERDISSTATHVDVPIPSSSLNQGLNFVKVNVGGKTVIKKVVKVQ